MITIRIPSLWQATADATRVEVEADNVQAALEALSICCPRLADKLFDEHGQLNSSLHLFVNHETVRLRGGLLAPLEPGDEVYIVPMIAGG